MEKLLEINKINKHFFKKQVLKDVSFYLNEGEILGFIGPNGAGKTTTIKLILGLQSIDSGSVKICGYNIETDFKKAINNVGAIVENPDLYMYLSGRDNLKMIASLYDNLNKDKVNELIKLVGLENRIDDKVSKYSLGMRQRLGIAAALINDPKVLILDEPTNGLDPEGIKELRDLLKKLAKEKGLGILISSHNLKELESFCTNICIIKNGEIINDDSINNIKELNKSSYIIKLNKVKGIDKIIKEEYKLINNKNIRIYVDEDKISNIIKKLISNGYDIYEVKKDKLSLEDAFLEKTGGNIID